MYITVWTYRARRGEEDAVVALHEDWEQRLRPRARGYLSGELLRDLDDPQGFIAIARYESEAAARASAEDPEQVTWRRRLASLAEGEPTLTTCRSTWRDP
jgi:quinol monooxygenase YgiN